MSTLKTDYKDDVFTGKRKYNQVNNADGTVSFNDVTEYAQVGDSYGASQINEVNDIVNNLDSKSYKSTDAAETSIADNDYFPFFDTSASAIKKSLWSNIKNVLTNVFAIKNHASNTTVYGTGNANLYGHVKLSDNYASSAGAASAAVGASSKAVNDAYNANKNSINGLSGTVSTNATTETTHYNELKGELTANSKRIYMDYKNGKYGINTSANRGADTFIPFNLVGDLAIYYVLDYGDDDGVLSTGVFITIIDGIIQRVIQSNRGGDGITMSYTSQGVTLTRGKWEYSTFKLSVAASEASIDGTIHTNVAANTTLVSTVRYPGSTFCWWKLK